MATFKRSRYFIGMHFHSVIVALLYEVPLLAINYSDKVKRVMHEYELDDYLISPNNPGEIVDKFTLLMKNVPEVVNRIREKNWDMAALFLKKAVECKPDFMPAYVNLAIAHACAGQCDEALNTMETIGTVKGDLAKIVDGVRKACRMKSRQALEIIPTVNINRQRTELFKKEKDLRMFYPFAARLGN